MRDLTFEVVGNTHILGKLWLLRVRSDGIGSLVKGGHFFMLEVSGSYDPMGRRAFAVGDLRGNELWFFYDVVGRGTELLSKLEKGDRLRGFGPLGKRLYSHEGERHLLIGGGVGLAGLTLFAKELMSEGKEVFIIYGGRTANHLGMLDWIKDHGFDFLAVTEDGSAGKKGLVTDFLSDFDESWTVSACGPKGMLRALIKTLPNHRLQISLEERMACGWGVCLGCVVPSHLGAYMRVCWEGPVFDAKEVRL
jgi:dihydroorotate dehydrogenase electron transfer subunit